MENALVYRIAHDTNEARLTILGVPDSYGIGAKIFHALAQKKIYVNSVIYNKVNGTQGVSFLIWKKDIAVAREAAEKIAAEIGADAIKIEDDMAKISVIGRGLHNPSGIVADLFEVFGDEKINIQMISTSETRVNCLVKTIEIEHAIQALLKKFSLSQAGQPEREIPNEEIDFELPFDAPFEYSLTGH